jgi:hypothetical protein
MTKSTITVRTAERGVTGAAIFTAGGRRWLWNGPGSGLRLEWTPGAYTTVDALEGLTAGTEREARELVREGTREMDAERCEVCGTRNTARCRFAGACSCWRGEPC